MPNIPRYKMMSHDVAEALLKLPNCPVVVDGPPGHVARVRREPEGGQIVLDTNKLRPVP